MKTHSISLIGKRDNNEDKHKIIINMDNNDKSLAPVNFFAVFDGHGGKNVSSYLEENYHKYFVNKFMDLNYGKYNSMINNFKKTHEHIQTKLEDKFRNISYTVGSTSLACLFYKKGNCINYYISNVGDCRAVLCNQYNKAIQLSVDHKPNSVDEKNRINQLGGKIYFDGYDWRVGNLSVSRAFGDIDSKPFVSHSPDVFKYSLSPQDKFLILACDGLWDVFSNQKAINFVLSKMKNMNIENNNKRNRNNIAQMLANEAIEIGSTDNISVVIIFFK